MPKPKRIEKALLPFAVCSQEKTIFNDEVEKATVFCLSELNREKEGGFLKKRDAEKLIFISKVYYPFWIMPIREMTVLLDGLNTTSHEISYPALPNLKSFKEILKNQPITHQVYTNFLSNNQNFFQSSTMQQELVEGLLNDSKFTIEFLEYTKEATTIKSPIVDSVLITPALDKEDVSKTFQRVE
ncbi:MAG: hypothetical protein KAJ19_14185, partial [Gammaproteobacteria bacterium]|nr:hypothetical protein [Gammaproteobacteria bacterium]